MLKEVRCAIYTRKSNEDGLEQKFNSLDAQRVACEKYIKSREGWVILAKRYDDGGYSGKNLERPAIKELFEDVKGGEVDCVVVYTLDRLSRETKDSIEVTSFFRRHRVNFVAVTQIFDNNTPMGKFVQTVLSGAAQLEREMIVERVKNKIATSKEHGLWMGGTLPFGYDVKDKELIINEKEAKTVKHIFERYVELKSMAELARELNREGYRTKGKSDIFKKATVRRIITNPIYTGKIRHYEKEYEGKHEAIIEEEKWQKAQELIRNQPYRKARYEEALLKGIIKCKSCDVNMTLTYSKKENKRYRYYICNNHLRGKGCESINRTIVAGEVEKEVMRKTEQLYEKWGEEWKNLSFREQKEVVKKLIKGVMVREDGIEVHSESEEKFIPIKKKGNKCTVVEPEGKTNNALLKAVVRAHLWKRQLEEGKYGSVKELSAKINIGTKRIQQILRLNYLAPKIKEDIVNGRQPSNLRLADLREIPMLWSEQMKKFYKLALSCS
ncbi:recombinase family protein [Wolbachia endosymbiont of Diaphorina citri]|uniref:recombinase family protein n=1 Tax=Wolbachia endosymbiont of Diaphorina citri TaxID=116598 RepID=UPI00155E21DA|nr:recombinase family protein [Wolbachia endosymbiont of Diaphorina citri]QJT94802.1 recombinase family protein [Wolbachia endosymbiont of Diaphorina citri]QJT94996.1 recombinase family protein [Wolbachia endosymbiont of Diaphorina citri]QJT96120.1 recombinase family protein [Wolbachia endosymbiont of Diaphorina citri]QJT96238.1 recombinase family protein [Wolbachia endosymbiont of Diaphorina citri]QJT96607.1 recombinase family protein [Wolbachia endosymbiont of Diaphorina citri]